MTSARGGALGLSMVGDVARGSPGCIAGGDVAELATMARDIPATGTQDGSIGWPATGGGTADIDCRRLGRGMGVADNGVGGWECGAELGGLESRP